MNNEHCEHREQNKQASSEFTGKPFTFNFVQNASVRHSSSELDSALT